jgi:hypothetical protein
MQLHLFGAATPTGEAFRECVASADFPLPLYSYSRSRAMRMVCPRKVHYADFCNPQAFFPAGDSGVPAIWVSFGPIWLLAPFLEQLACEHPERLAALRGLIASSSSSAITKRFAFNRLDRELVTRLNSAEYQLLATCRRINVPCCILQPTLVYGQVGPYGDGNLSLIHKHLRSLPLLPLPSDSGLRQPIHASQLASVALHFAQKVADSGWVSSLPERIALGGDTTLTYSEMIIALQEALPFGTSARRCRLLTIPNRLFFLLAGPLLFYSPKAFEAVLRMGSDLSGFTPAYQLLGAEPQPFPVLPLA